MNDLEKDYKILDKVDTMANLEECRTKLLELTHIAASFKDDKTPYEEEI